MTAQIIQLKGCRQAKGVRINPQRVAALAAEIERMIDSPKNERERAFSRAVKELQAQ